MKKETVRRRIFLSNTRMVLTALGIILFFNLVLAKGYWELLEREMRSGAEMIVDGEELEELLGELTVRRNDFLTVLLADGIFCVAVLAVTSRIFAGSLARHIMEPLDLLTDGAERVGSNDLTAEIPYTGDLEFEKVCGAFNHMQKHILAEQEKNRRYEKARADMTAGLSHDLRTPLTAVRGAIKGLLDGVAASPEQQKRFLETAYKRTGDMEFLLQQLFYLSKLESGNLPVSLRPVDIAVFVNHYVQRARELLAAEDLMLEARTDNLKVWVYADPEQLKRIFDNLLENSRKYGEVSPLFIKISLGREPKGVRVTFQDNGKGIADDKLPHIFEEFYRGDESRSQKEGSGLGLYIVKFLMEAMGGSVRAENRDGLAVDMTFRTAGKGEIQHEDK